jgi:hypothetical protein
MTYASSGQPLVRQDRADRGRTTAVAAVMGGGRGAFFCTAPFALLWTPRWPAPTGAIAGSRVTETRRRRVARGDSPSGRDWSV